MQAGNDNSHRNDAGLFADFIMAMRFYSRLWVGGAPHERPDLSRIAMAAPFASLVIGLGPAAILSAGGALGVPAYFAASLAVLAFIAITGAMAEDGLGDSADGLAGGHTRERRLEIFKDSRLGTYGVCAIGAFLLLRVTGLGGIAEKNALAAAGCWLAACLLARSLSLWLPLSLPPARLDGVSASAAPMRNRAFFIGMSFAILLSFILIAPFGGVLGWLVGLLAGIAIVWGWSGLCARLVGGQTGDLIGALQGLLEIVLICVFVVVTLR